MVITAAQVSSLRKRTGVSMMAVKKALEEAQGDEEQAIKILRKRGEAQAVTKGGRDQSEGSIFIASAHGQAALLELSCETDFVARGDDFVQAGKKLATIALEQGEDAARNEASVLVPALINKLGENITLTSLTLLKGKTIGTYVHTNGKIGVAIALDGGTQEIARSVAMHAAAMAPEVVSPEEVSLEAVEKEKEIWKAQLKAEGKPENIWDKIMMGKERKFREESALLKQAFVKDPSITVEKYLNGAKVTGYVRLAV